MIHDQNTWYFGNCWTVGDRTTSLLHENFKIWISYLALTSAVVTTTKSKLEIEDIKDITTNPSNTASTLICQETCQC